MSPAAGPHKSTAVRVAAAARTAAAGWTVLTEDAVCYATGSVVGVETGRVPFAGGPGTRTGRSRRHQIPGGDDLEEPAARPARADAVEVYAGFTGGAPLEVAAAYDATRCVASWPQRR